MATVVKFNVVSEEPQRATRVDRVALERAIEGLRNAEAHAKILAVTGGDGSHLSAIQERKQAGMTAAEKLALLAAHPVEKLEADARAGNHRAIAALDAGQRVQEWYEAGADTSKIVHVCNAGGSQAAKTTKLQP